MPTFSLNNGTVYNCPFCGLASVGILYVDIMGVDLMGALTAFGDVTATVHMEYVSEETRKSYDGFTKILGVEYAYNNADAVRVSLRRPYEGE